MVSLGTMSIVCQYCLALKCNDESKGMCCLQIDCLPDNKILLA